MLKGMFTIAAAATLLGAAVTAQVQAQESVQVGLVLPMTGPFASTGRQVEAGARLYMQQHGDEVGGRKIELIVKDDGGVADQTKRIAQELVVREGADVLAGFGLTPLAMATAPIATQARVPMIVMAAATSSITEKSPFIVRSSFTLPQAALGIARWAAENGITEAATLVSDYAPGHDAADAFRKVFEEAGGTVIEQAAVPLKDPDFAPYLQRIRDAGPQGLFVFVPSGVGSLLMKQFDERGLDDAGIKLIATGDVTDDDILDQMGDVALGAITAQHYSAAHDSPENKEFVDAFKEANGNSRPNFMAVGGYDGMHLVYEALKATDGETGEALVEAMKGLSWESPRGPVSIDPETRDIVQDIYIREVKEQDGELYNVEFDRIEQVKDPVKADWSQQF
ncbi:ABC transporter substrate-binding protein [Lutibaculum baratangense]|uniref:Benzoate transport, extracellular ligand-binding receptor n=1 Tax=Lutibaculum baratangense AMV1 TaxID=631454 RepID=V4RIW6_9HYPH|nr:Benzoate transport, extracellular ligand-binding receptor [Lutibaculum baratangense AMV1]